jgi:hypothetical protein
MPKKKTYSRDDILQAKRVMLNELASLSSGQLIPGCCTQGCCDDDPPLTVSLIADLRPPPYSKREVIQAKRAMLNHLANLSDGVLIAGCCTQGCCDPDAMDALINVP